MSSTPTPICRSPFSDLQAYLKVPSTNYRHTLSVGRPETSLNIEVLHATIVLHVQQWYKLYMEPIRGHPLVTMEDDYLVSPKFTWKFKVPLSLLMSSTASHFCCPYISKELASLPIDSGLAQYLKPHIIQNAVAWAQINNGTPTEFNMAFDVQVVKIDLADEQECDGYRRRGLIQ